MSDGRGPLHSPLDDIRPERWTSQFTTELLELFWVLEAILAGDCIRADELPAVLEPMRSPKKAKPATGDPFDFEE